MRLEFLVMSCFRCSLTSAGTLYGAMCQYEIHFGRHFSFLWQQTDGELIWKIFCLLPRQSALVACSATAVHCRTSHAKGVTEGFTSIVGQGGCVHPGVSVACCRGSLYSGSRRKDRQHEDML